MQDGSPTLSVMIPAYGRPREFEAMLRAFAAEPAVAEGRVALVVSDDVCPDHSGDIVRSLQQELPGLDLRLHTQERNLGQAANIRWLHAHADTDYIWMFGNDDRPLPGSVAHVLRALEQHRPVLLHLPHVHQRSRDADWGRSPKPAETQVFSSSHDFVLEYGYWVSLMSATVVRRDAMSRALADCPNENEWVDYLLYTVAGREGTCVVLPERVLENGFARPTWIHKHDEIYTTELVRLFDDGFSLVFDAVEFARLLDNRYDSIAVDVWPIELIDELTAAVERFPYSRHLRRRLGEMGRARSDQRALAAVERAAQITGDAALASELVAEAEQRFAAGHLAQARELAFTATALHPTSVAAWCDAGVICDALGEADAPTSFDQALRASPEDHDALLNLAAWSRKHGLDANAEQYARRALASRPDSADAAAFLGSPGTSVVAGRG